MGFQDLSSEIVIVDVTLILKQLSYKNDNNLILHNISNVSVCDFGLLVVQLLW